MRLGSGATKPVSPVKAFAIVAGILVAVGATWYLTASNGTPSTTLDPAPSAEPDFSLTDEEAIARAKELERLVLRAYTERDLSLLPDIYSAESKLLGKVRKEIQYLLRRDIKPQAHFNLLEMDVQKNTAQEIVLVERAEFDTRFFDASGRDVTRSGRPELQTTRLTLRLQRDEWLIFDSVITHAKPL